MWFQQDGATAHTARPTMALLREIFGDQILRFSDFNWPSRSSYLTVPNLFLWGDLKGKVYKPRIIQEVKGEKPRSEGVGT